MLLNPYRFGAAAIADPYFQNVSLLLHMDGANGATAFADSSPRPKSVQAFGNAQISTTQSKYGGASGKFDGSGDYLTVPDSADLQFGTGDFTLEAWVYYSAAPAVGDGYSIYCSSSSFALPATFFITDARTLAVWNNGLVPSVVTGSAVPVEQWVHIAWVRASGALSAYINGVQQWTVAYTANHAESAGVVGANPGASSGFMNGHLDDLRITKGVARYTANFTPPSAPFPNQ